MTPEDKTEGLINALIEAGIEPSQAARIAIYDHVVTTWDEPDEPRGGMCCLRSGGECHEHRQERLKADPLQPGGILEVDIYLEAEWKRNVGAGSWEVLIKGGGRRLSAPQYDERGFRPENATHKAIVRVKLPPYPEMASCDAVDAVEVGDD